MERQKALLISIIILIIVYAFFCIYTYYNKTLEVSSMMEHPIYYTKNINIDEEIYYVTVKYPYTLYKEINEYINKNIQDYIYEFELSMKSKMEKMEEKYFLIIKFETKETNQYLNFIFHIQQNSGGVHPENKIFTVCIDKNSKKVITLKELKNKYNNYLERVSSYCYNELKEMDIIKEYGAFVLLENGTKAKASNYEKQIITEREIKILFEHSQVAPYSLGYFVVKVPIQYLK